MNHWNTLVKFVKVTLVTIIMVPTVYNHNQKNSRKFEYTMFY